VAPFADVAGPDGLARAAAEVGFPMVLKADASGVVHKAEAGAVELGLDDPTRLSEAFSRLVSRFPDASFLAQRQVADGVETTRDVAFTLCPACEVDARGMLERLRGRALLETPGRVDVEAFVSILVRLSSLATDFPEISVIDLNPVKVLPAGRGAFVVDVRILDTPPPGW
jgi:acyl-CoA synthetase (NDP forming)